MRPAAAAGGITEPSAIVTRLRRISDCFEAYRGRRGGFACDRHRGVVHYGKLAYLLPIDGFLLEQTGEEHFLDRALEMVRALSGQLRRVDGVTVFYPGRLHPHNASNNAIDSGAIVDSLTDWWSRYADRTPAELGEFLDRACLEVADSYLVRVGGKPTNQVLWAMTGLAGVWRHLEHRDLYREVCRQALRDAFEDQNADGSFPYLPARLAGADHPSLHEVSGYYHSRHVGFIVDVAEKIGHRFSTEESEQLRRAIDFLCALYGGDGRKSLELEAKHWYWSPSVSFELASSTFDLHALAWAVRTFAEPEHERCLHHAVRAFLDSVGPTGGLATPRGEEHFQCSQFWSAHAAWVVKAWRAGIPEVPFRACPQADYRGSESGVLTLTDESWHVKLRRRRRPLTPLFGGYAAGSPWALCHRSDDWAVDLLPRRRFSLAAPGEIFVFPGRSTAGGIGSRMRRRIGDRAAYRFLLSRVRDELVQGAFRRGVRLLRRYFVEQERFLAGGVYSSFWALESSLEVDGERICLVGRLARADGVELVGSRLERWYDRRPDRLHVTYRLGLTRSPGRVLFVPPPTARRLVVEGALSHPGAAGLWLRGGGSEVRLCFDILPAAAAEDQLADWRRARRVSARRRWVRDVARRRPGRTSP